MRTSLDNPLLQLDGHLLFDRVKADHVEPAINALLADANAALDAIKAVDGTRTRANTLDALDAATERLEIAYTMVSHLEAVLGEPEMRTAYNAVQPAISAFYSAISLDAGLFAALADFATTDEAKALDPVPARLLKKTLDDFRRHGAELGAADKTRLQALQVQLAQVCTAFAQNVVDATDAFSLVITDAAQLAGLPPSAVDAARASAEAADVEGWRFTLQAPSYLAVMQHMDHAPTREALFKAYNTRATTGERDNREHLEQILKLRAEKAKLLGYADIADFLLEDRMVKSGAAAIAFVEALADRTQAYFAAEHVALEAFRRELEGDGAEAMQPWDLSYYAEKQRRALYAFDSEALRPYFSVDGVLDGMFEIASRLYGITIEPLDDLPLWHESASAYAVNNNDGSRMGVFYTDLFPRSGKRGGAWMGPFKTGGAGHEAIAVMAANATAPIGDKPALLTHREVETLFHEFGHLLHHLLSEVEVRSLGGTNVAWDFVELPSQIMENWCWEREALDVFARHYETGEPLPGPLFEKMKRARVFRAGYAQMRQLGFATVDLRLHRAFDPDRDGDVIAFAKGVAQQFFPVELPAEFSMITGFTHLFASPTGYAAAYYSYKWAEVLDADAFTRFAKEGLFSREVGDAFRREILARGDSADPAQLYEAFMGRGPDQEALFQRAGLKS